MHIYKAIANILLLACSLNLWASNCPKCDVTKYPTLDDATYIKNNSGNTIQVKYESTTKHLYLCSCNPSLGMNIANGQSQFMSLYLKGAYVNKNDPDCPSKTFGPVQLSVNIPATTNSQSIKICTISIYGKTGPGQYVCNASPSITINNNNDQSNNYICTVTKFSTINVAPR